MERWCRARRGTSRSTAPSRATSRGAPLQAIRAGLRPLTFAPWAADDPAFSLPRDRLLATLAGVPGGVVIRHGTSVAHPARVPDLIGIRERRYLDATGLVRHRAIGDLMRYSAANQTIDMLASYGGYMPAGVGGRERPEPGRGRFVGTGSRYGDCATLRPGALPLCAGAAA